MKKNKVSFEMTHYTSPSGIKVVVGCRVCRGIIREIETDYNPVLQVVNVKAKCHGKVYHQQVSREMVVSRHKEGLPIILEFGDEEELMGVMDAQKVKFEVNTTPGKRLITLKD